APLHPAPSARFRAHGDAGARAGRRRAERRVRGPRGGGGGRGDARARPRRGAPGEVRRGLPHGSPLKPRRVPPAAGGVLTLRAVRHATLRRAFVASLAAPVDVLLERLRHGPERPLIAHASDPRRALEDLLELRRDAYAEAHLRIDTSALDTDRIATTIAARY